MFSVGCAVLNEQSKLKQPTKLNLLNSLSVCGWLECFVMLMCARCARLHWRILWRKNRGIEIAFPCIFCGQNVCVARCLATRPTVNRDEGESTHFRFFGNISLLFICITCALRCTARNENSGYFDVNVWMIARFWRILAYDCRWHGVVGTPWLFLGCSFVHKFKFGAADNDAPSYAETEWEMFEIDFVFFFVFFFYTLIK